MPLAFQLLANQPTPETLPSATARNSLLVAVGRHEDRLQTLRRQMEGALWRGEAEANEALQTAAYELEAGLSALFRAVLIELDELIAACEDGLASATAAAMTSSDGGASVLEEMVANARQQLRELPSMLSESSSRCSEVAVAALRGASEAAVRAIGDGASSLVCGCGVAESAAASELVAAQDLLATEVLRAAGERPRGESGSASWPLAGVCCVPCSPTAEAACTLPSGAGTSLCARSRH